MTVYVDKAMHTLGRLQLGHMIADTPAELHAMAQRLGIGRHYQGPDKASFPHYDVCLSKREQAVRYLGAVRLDRREFAQAMRRIKDGPGYPENWRNGR